MSQPDSMPPAGQPESAHAYPNAGPAATPSLAARIRGRIGAAGEIGFPEFMSMALYDPELGYYARTTGQVGRGGDFYTSVSVGPLFGSLLARRFVRWRADRGGPGRWRITECGAHDGSLAADILDGVKALADEAAAGLEYVIIEPQPLLRRAQERKLAAFAPRVRWVSTAAALEPLPGIVFGNELLDALPFHIIAFQQGRWIERTVRLDAAGNFAWGARDPEEPELRAFLSGLEGPFPDGYQTEVRTGIRGFLEPLARQLDGGLMVWPDYGFPKTDYYHPSRATGTLRTYAKHRAGENPLDAPGERDITAHVDFTTVAEAIASLGGEPAPLRPQGAWLTGEARDWLLEQEGAPDARALRQFQTLTHPGHLGRSFLILEADFR